MRAKGNLLLLIVFTTLFAAREIRADSVTLQWNPSPSAGVTGYNLYWTLPDGTGEIAYNVGNTTAARVDNLTAGQTYHFYATAYDNNGSESGPSNTLIYTVPGTNPPPSTNTPPSSVSVKFVKSDTATRGNWKGVYGSEGYLMAGVSPGLPSYATVTTSAPQYTWAGNNSNPSALQVPGNSTNRIAAGWYSSTVVAFDMSINDGKSHRLAMYFLDADSAGRQQRVDLLDPVSGATLDSRSISGFSSGVYLVWDVTGKVLIRLTPSGANANAVTSALFFDAAGATSQPTNQPPVLAPIADQFAAEGQVLQFTASASDPDSGQTLSFSLANAPAGAAINSSGVFSWTPPVGEGPSTNNVTVSVADNGQPSLSASRTFKIIVPDASVSANFIGSDGDTRGNWKGKYGTQGYWMVGAPASLPGSANITTTAPQWTWASPSTNPSSLQLPNSTNRIAACWYSATQVRFDFSVTDGQPHRVSMYLFDASASGRQERVDVVDRATGALLDSRSLSNFVTGVYLTWEVKGNVSIRSTTTVSSANAVVSGIFFDGIPAAAPATSARFVTSDTTTRGNWKGVYGTEGYWMAGVTAALPTYATVTTSAPQWTWAANSSSPSALQIPGNTTNRIAACWYSSTQVAFDTSIVDGKPHRLSMYFFDGDSSGRQQRVDLVDAVSGATLDSRSLAGFSTGVYLVWDITGRILIRITPSTPHANAVASGFFLDAAAP